MQKTFLSNLTLLLALNLLIKPSYLLFVEAEVQNRVGAEVFGNYTALLSLSFLLNIFLDLGINTYTSRTVAQNQRIVAKHLENVLGLRLLLFGGYMILLIASALVLSYRGEDIQMIYWLGFNQLLAGSLIFVRSNLSGMMLFKKDAIISVLDRGLLLIGLGALLLAHNKGDFFDIYWLIYGQTFAYLGALLLSLFFLFRNTGKLKIKWQPLTQRAILKRSLPYALLVLLMMIYYKTDTIMLERMLDNGDFHAGIYAKAYRLFEASNMLGYLFATLLLPLFSVALKKREDVSPLVGNAFKIMIVGGAVLAGTSIIWPEFILGLLYDIEITETAPVFTTLMISFVFMLLTYLWGTLLTANGDMRTMNIIAVFAVVLNIVLNVILIPTYQAWGSAVASLSTQILVTVCQVIMCYRLIKLKLGASLITRVIVFLALLATLSYLITIIPIGLEFKVLSYPVVGVLLAFAVGLLRLVDIRSIIQSRSKTR